MKNIYLQFFSNLIQKMKYYVSFIRVYNTRSMILFYLLGRKMAGTLQVDKDIVLIPIIFITVYAYASILNFIHDQKIDQLNKRVNPLLKQSLNLKKLEMISVIFIVLSFGLCFFSTKLFHVFIMTFILIFLSYLYSSPPLKLSHHPFGKITTMIMVYLIIPFLIGIDLQFTREIILVICPLIFYFGSFLLYSDIKDMEGDKKYEKRTPAVVLGLQKTLWVSALLGVASSFSLLLLSRQSVFYPNVFAFIIIVPAIFQVVAAVKTHVVRNKKYGMLVGYLIMSPLVFLIVYYKLR